MANIGLRVGVLDGLLLYNNRDGYDLLLDWLSRAVNLPLAFPAVHRKGGVLALVLASIWLAAGLVALSVLTAIMSKRRSRGAQWALTGAVGVAVSTVAIDASWRVGLSVEETPQSSKIAFVRRWRPDMRSLAIELPGLHRLQTRTLLSKIDLSTSRRAREAVPDPALLTVAWLPAGDYQLIADGDRELSGTLTVSVGQTSRPMDTWRLDGLAGGDRVTDVSLPALAHSLVVRGDDAARRTISRLWLRPLAIRPSVDAYGEYIIRATRYEHVRLFELDDDAYLEPTGLWTRGNATARLAITSDLERVPIELRAGPVATTVRMVIGEWTSETGLVPGQHRRIEIPGNGVLTIRTNGAFRPVDYDPATRDARALGVRVEFPAP